MAATYEVRFQTVPPEKREEYVKMYKQAIQEIKLSGCKRGGTAGVGEQGASSALARHAAAYAFSSRRRGLAVEAKLRRVLFRRNNLATSRSPCLGGGGERQT